MEVLFASLQHHCFWCFFRSRGPKLCPNRTGNSKFYKNLTRKCAYTRFPWSHICPKTSRNKGDFTEKFSFGVFPDQLEQNSEVFGVFTHLHILYMCAKLRKLKAATQYLALKMRNCESYFLRKRNFFLKKPKKMQKK